MKKPLLMALLALAAFGLAACTPAQPSPTVTPLATVAPQTAAPTEATVDTPAEATEAPGAQAEAPVAQYRKISAEQAKARMDSGDAPLVIDVRTAEEYAEGHIAGAVLLPLAQIDESVQELLTDKDAELLVYCRSGNRSRAAAQLLVDMGYTNVHDFGGVNGWPYGLVTD